MIGNIDSKIASLIDIALDPDDDDATCAPDTLEVVAYVRQIGADGLVKLIRKAMKNRK
jgi:hypothetical protein